MKRGLFFVLVFVLVLALLSLLSTSVLADHSFGPELSLNRPLNELFLIAFGLLIVMMISAVLLEKNVAAVSTRVGSAIGTTLLAFASSLPLVVFALTAALAGEIGIAINNIIGTNIANLTLVLGGLALLKPLNSGKNVLKGISALAIVLIVVFLIFFTVNPFDRSIEQSSVEGRVIGYEEGFILLGLFVLFILLLQFFGTESEVNAKAGHMLLHVILILVFGVAVCWCANQSVLAFIKIANIYALPAFIISSVLVVIGTSFPEFAIGLVSIFHREDENVFSNLITSDVVNFVFCPGLIALFIPLYFGGLVLGLQIPFMIFTILIASWFLYSAPKQITRREGFILVGLFVLYLFLMGVGYFVVV